MKIFSLLSLFLQWDLICSKSSLPNLSQSAFFVGTLLGAWIWGKLTDMIGRQKAFFISAGCVVAAGVGYALAFNFYMFVAFRVLTAINVSGFIMSSFVLTVEIVGVSARGVVGMIGPGAFGLAYSVVAAAAYFIRSWRVLSILLSVVGVGVFALIRLALSSSYSYTL